MVDRYRVWLGAGVLAGGVSAALLAGAGVAAADDGMSSSSDSGATSGSDGAETGPKAKSDADKPSQDTGAKASSDADDGADAATGEGKHRKKDSVDAGFDAAPTSDDATKTDPEEPSDTETSKPDSDDTSEDTSEDVDADVAPDVAPDVEGAQDVPVGVPEVGQAEAESSSGGRHRAPESSTTPVDVTAETVVDIPVAERAVPAAADVTDGSATTDVAPTPEPPTTFVASIEGPNFTSQRSGRYAGCCGARAVVG